MPKNAPASRVSEPQPSVRTYLDSFDPLSLWEMLEAKNPNNDDPYRTLFHRTFEQLLTERAEPETEAFAKMLHAVDVYIGVESATRGAAFVVGFETCRQLMLGEVKGGAA